MVDPQKAIPEAIEKIRKEYFHDFKFALLFTELCDMWSEGKPIDLLTVCQRLEDKGVSKKVGGRSELTTIWGFVPSSVNLTYYIGILREKWLARETHEVASKLAKSAIENDDKIEEVLAEGQSAILALNQSENSVKSIVEHGNEALEHIEKLYANKGEIIGLTTGLIDLDRKLRGIKPGTLVIIAAPTSWGKTALALNIAEHQAIERGNGVAIFSIEMTGDELFQRLVQSRSGVNIAKDAERGGLGMQKISAATSKLMDAPLYIRDDVDISSAQIRAIARKLSHEHDIKLIIVDYIGLVTPNINKDGTEEQGLSEIAQQMLKMAKELKCGVILLSQLNDDGKLRGSRAPGHHAHICITIEKDKENEPLGRLLHISKNRNGERGRVAVVFLEEITKFVDRSYKKDLIIERS